MGTLSRTGLRWQMKHQRLVMSVSIPVSSRSSHAIGGKLDQHFSGDERSHHWRGAFALFTIKRYQSATVPAGNRHVDCVGTAQRAIRSKFSRFLRNHCINGDKLDVAQSAEELNLQSSTNRIAKAPAQRSRNLRKDKEWHHNHGVPLIELRHKGVARLVIGIAR
jgi:hypothetical protein